MNDSPKENVPVISCRQLAGRAALSIACLWLAQPPCKLWPLAFIALVPLIDVVAIPGRITRRGYGTLWAVATIYWLVSLQGLRFAHPAMILCLMALAGYLAVYQLLFVGIARRAVFRGSPWVSLVWVAPLVWVGLECIRNYLLTGISVLMLGHSMAETPLMIQVADMFGTYGVSFVIVQVNVAAWLLLRLVRAKRTQTSLLFPAESRIGWTAASISLLATLAYGWHRLNEPLGQPTETFALIQRDEEVEYGQPVDREVEMFQNYANESVRGLRAASEPVDVVVWPESMFSGGTPWMIAGADFKVPEVPGRPDITRAEFLRGVEESRGYFLERAGYALGAMAAANSSGQAPHLLAGCGVVRYGAEPEVYSGVISMDPQGAVTDWYGKTHLVMFGEYIPIAPLIPGLRSLIPPGLGLQTGPGAKRFQVNDHSVAPNICVETAVERVTINQLRTLHREHSLPDVVVTVTNDGWFDDSSVIEHHLRCAQLVSVGCRRPILSAANNGPTAWIDSRGQVVRRLATGTSGAVIATPQQDLRVSVYLRLGDWPARLLALLTLVLPWVAGPRKQPSSS